MLMVKYTPRLNILMVTYPKAANTLIPKPIPKDTPKKQRGATGKHPGGAYNFRCGPWYVYLVITLVMFYIISIEFIQT